MKRIGILTSGGDCPGLNAAIRGVCRAGQKNYGMSFIGFRDGFRGLVQDKSVELEAKSMSGILTLGGTILGTSRDKPHRMPMGGKTLDMTEAAVETYNRHHLDALVCIGGGGTQKNAFRLSKSGINIVTLPKTIDNDIGLTDVSFGFDTAVGIATDALDRLHSTAMSHGRSIVVEVMGHRAGWLALGAGTAAGADVILIPEIPYSTESVSKAICERNHAGKAFSIVVVAEGCMSQQQADTVAELVGKKKDASTKEEKKNAAAELRSFHNQHVNHTLELTRELENTTGLESRLTILGHLQRGGTPSSADRILATRLGTACAHALDREEYGVMIAERSGAAVPVPLSEVAGNKKLVPIDHPLVQAAKDVGTCLGD